MEGTGNFFALTACVDSLDESGQETSLVVGIVISGAIFSTTFEQLGSTCLLLVSNMEEDSSSSSSDFWRSSFVFNSQIELSLDLLDDCWIDDELKSDNVVSSLTTAGFEVVVVVDDSASSHVDSSLDESSSDDEDKS